MEREHMKKKPRPQGKNVKQQKRKAKSQNSRIFNKFYVYGRLALLIAVAILLFYPPYFRGLFFAAEMLATNLATSAVFLLWCITSLRKKDAAVRMGPLDWLVLGYAAMYCISIIGAVDTRQAMSGALKALNYGLIYFLVAQITLDFKIFKNWLAVLYASSVGVALIGIGCAAGYVNYPAGFDGRNITSTLQYVNATSAYMAIMSIIGITLALNAEKTWLQVLYSFTASLLILVSVNAASKGAWVIFVLALFLFLVGMPSGYRIKSVYLFIATLAAGLASSYLFMHFILNEQPISALFRLSAGLGIVLAAIILWQAMVRFQQGQGTWRTAALSVSGLAAAAAAGWILVGNKAVTAFGNIAAEMAQFTDFQSSSFVSRWAMYGDAASIIRDHPVLGTGGGGWNLLYHQYQDFLYWTTEVHSHLLQVGVETGIPGMLIWLGLFAALAYYIYRIRTNGIDDQGKVVVWGVGTAVFALGAHSLIDFDLSIPSLQILFFALLGLVASAFRPYSKLINLRNSKRMLTTGIVISSSVAMLSASLLFAILMSNQGAKLTASGDIQSALSKFEKASTFDPFNGQYHGAMARIYAQLYAANAGGDSLRSEWSKLTVYHSSLAEEKAPYDRQLLANVSGSYGLIGAVDDAIRLYEKVLSLNPWDVNLYNNLARIYVQRIQIALETGDMSTAKKYLKLALAIPERIEQQAAKARTDVGFQLAPDITTNYILAQAHYYQGDYPTALQEFESLLGQTFAAEDEFKTMYAAALYKNGRQVEAEQVMADFKAAKPAVYSQYLKIRNLPAVDEG